MTIIISITICLMITWGIAFIERADALTSSKREPSVWSLLLTGFFLVIQLLLLYVESALLHG